VTIFDGALDLPVRPSQAADALPPLPGPETATPERPTVIRPGVVRIDRIGLELGTEGTFAFDLKDDESAQRHGRDAADPDDLARGLAGKDRTQMRLSCTRARSSCGRHCAPGKAPAKSVIANGTAPFRGICRSVQCGLVPPAGTG